MEISEMVNSLVRKMLAWRLEYTTVAETAHLLAIKIITFY